MGNSRKDDRSTQQLRILQVIPSIARSMGGPSTGSLRLNEAFNRTGMVAVLLTTTSLNDSGGRDPIAEVEAAATSQTRAFEPSRPFRLKNSWGLAYAILRYSRNADFIHVHGFYLAHVVYAYIASRLFDVQLAIQPHGVFEPYQQRVGRPQKAVFDAVIGGRIIRRVDTFVYASESERVHAHSKTKGGRSVVAPLGVQLLVPTVDQEIDQVIGSRQRSSVFLYVGRFAKKKNPDMLIRAWSRAYPSLPEGSILLLVGPDEDFTGEDLTRLALERSAVGVSTFSQRDGSVCSWLYGKAGTFILPSDNENFGQTVLEALASGCAVITTDDVASSKLVSDSGAGVVVRSGSDDVIVDALAAIGEPERLRAEVVSKALRSVDSWAATAEVLAAHYASRLRTR